MPRRIDPTEDQEQIALIQWVRQPLTLRQYPELHLFYAVHNNVFTGWKNAKRLKMLGGNAGIPDLCLPVARQGYHGLYIEMKRRLGRPSEAQQEKIMRLQAEDYMAEICHSWLDAVALLKWYLKRGGGEDDKRMAA